MRVLGFARRQHVEQHVDRGWTEESFASVWPMDIPPPVTEREDDPLDLPLRVPQSRLLSNPFDQHQSNEGAVNV